MGFHELAKVIPAISRHHYFCNASLMDPANVAAFEGGVKAAHWVPEDVFQQLNAVPLYDGHIKVYPTEAAAVRDLQRAWAEVTGPR